VYSKLLFGLLLLLLGEIVRDGKGGEERRDVMSVCVFDGW